MMRFALKTFGIIYWVLLILLPANVSNLEDNLKPYLIPVPAISVPTRRPGSSGSTSPSGRPKPPQGFPLRLRTTEFINWAEDIEVRNVWTAYPKNAPEVVACANWGMNNTEYNLRAGGVMHTWSPLSVTPDEEGDSPQTFNCGKGREYNYFPSFMPPAPSATPRPVPDDNIPPDVILLKTSKLDKMGMISTDPESSAFWVEPGALMEDVMSFLEKNNLGFLASPAPGSITIGGALAIAGHGTGVPAEGESLPPGHTYGTLSNLLINVTAVVFDDDKGEYILKTFHRSDPEAKAFLVHLGRTFVTNFTMRVGPLENLRCESYVDIPALELFSSVESSSVRTFSSFLKSSGRVEVILYPFTDNPWLKVWSVKETQPASARRVDGPYNYPFSDNIYPPVDTMVTLVQERQQYYMARALGWSMYAVTVQGLKSNNAMDLWGPSKNLLLYVKPTTLRYAANGYAILTTRDKVQAVLSKVYSFYTKILFEYEANRKYPINGPLEIRVTGWDDPADVNVPGAESPAMSPLQPVVGSPQFDTAIWFDVLTFANTPYACDFMAELEDFLLQNYRGGRNGTIRVEWSKGWAYTKDSPWANTTFFEKEFRTSRYNYRQVKKIYDKYDPYEVFSNKFLRKLFSTEV